MRFSSIMAVLTLLLAFPAFGESFFSAGGCKWNLPDGSIVESREDGAYILGRASKSESGVDFYGTQIEFAPERRDAPNHVCLFYIGEWCVMASGGSSRESEYYVLTYNYYVVAFSGFSLEEVGELYTGQCK